MLQDSGGGLGFGIAEVATFQEVFPKLSIRIDTSGWKKL